MFFNGFFQKEGRKWQSFAKKTVIWYYRAYHSEELDVEGLESTVSGALRKTVRFWARDSVFWLAYCSFLGALITLFLAPLTGFKPSNILLGFGAYLTIHLCGELSQKVRGS